MASPSIGRARPITIPGSETHGNTKGAPHGTSHTSCLAMERSALSAELGVYLVRGLRIPIHAAQRFQRTSATHSDGTRSPFLRSLGIGGLASSGQICWARPQPPDFQTWLIVRIARQPLRSWQLLRRCRLPHRSWSTRPCARPDRPKRRHRLQ